MALIDPLGDQTYEGCGDRTDLGCNPAYGMGNLAYLGGLADPFMQWGAHPLLGFVWDYMHVGNCDGCVIPVIAWFKDLSTVNFDVDTGGEMGGATQVVANTTGTSCSVAVDCDTSSTPHCGITVGEQDGTYTRYDGEPSTDKLSKIMNPFSSVTLTVQVLPNSPPPGGHGGGNIIFQSPESCTVANCIEKSASYTKAGELPYHVLTTNSNWWASTTTRVCGVSVKYPKNAIGAE